MNSYVASYFDKSPSFMQHFIRNPVQYTEHIMHAVKGKCIATTIRRGVHKPGFFMLSHIAITVIDMSLKYA